MRPFLPSYLGVVLVTVSVIRNVSATAYVQGDWVLTQQGSTGVSALQLAVTGENTIIILDKAEDNPLVTDDGRHAMAAELNLLTRTVRPLNGAVSNVWCAGGGFLSNGTFVNSGGNPAILGSENGLQAVRLFDPCDDETCDIIEDSGVRMRLTSPRWYPGAVRLDDGSLLIAGGSILNSFINIIDINNPTYEFYPPKNINGFNGVQIPMKFLNDTLNANLFPYMALLPDGTIFVAANTQSMIFDWKTNTERRLPDIPNGIRMSYPYSGSAALLPLTPENNYTPEILICGGSNISDTLDGNLISSQTPASNQCSRMVLTNEGIETGWITEEMPIARTMGELFALPDGRMILVNGAQTGFSGYSFGADPIGDSTADHPSFTPVVYDPEAPEGQRFSTSGIPTTNIARLYHSTATMTANGTIFIAGSNPHENLCFDQYPTEYRAEYLDPPYMFLPRPSIAEVPTHIGYNQSFDLEIELPGENDINVTVILMDLGYSTHGVHQSSRYVRLVSNLSGNSTSMTVTGPPTPQIYPPGPAYLYVVTAEGVPSPGKKVIIGDGQSPPVDEDAIQKYGFPVVRLLRGTDISPFCNSMFDETRPPNITFSQVRQTPACQVSGGGESITGSFPPVTVTGETTLLPPTPLSSIPSPITDPQSLPTSVLLQTSEPTEARITVISSFTPASELPSFSAEVTSVQ
ncbi:hypothetical protein K435DRAFT_683195 [Dendrothele bispora CBS 962.96]|uniref:Copper radical oxidase n=1 Tax=Dendrothele bispora (strain CBS 962.96) TaxID=1314807 RepID=A0A4S8LCM5_DENBC|nr:hypothetical protein K435DRAFT_683195 [Dendrothele bispora CBS 962.96]